MEIDTIFQLFFLSPIRVEKSIVYTYVPNKRGIAYIDVRSEDFFPSESYEIGVLARIHRPTIENYPTKRLRGRLSFPKRRLISIDLISGYYAKRMAENDTRIIVTAFTLPPIPIYVDIWHMGNLNGAWKMDAFSVVSNVTGIVPVLTYHHGGYRCMRQISGNYRAHFNQSTWQAWNTRDHPRLLRIIVGRMIISQGSRG